MVHSVHPVKVLGVLSAESSSTSSPEDWTILSTAASHVCKVTFTLRKSLIAASSHIAFSMWDSKKFEFGTCWWGAAIEEITVWESTAATDFILNSNVGWWIFFLWRLHTSAHHWHWGHPWHWSHTWHHHASTSGHSRGSCRRR